jgi:hypothetical protein
LALNASKKCSASYTTCRPALRTNLTESPIILTFSSADTPRTFVACHSLLLPTIVTTGVCASTSDRMPGSSSARIPRRRVMPNAATFAWRSFISRTSRKNATSFGLESGKPPSM